MPPDGHPLQTDTQTTEDAKANTAPADKRDSASDAPKGGMGGYVVCLKTRDTRIEFGIDLVPARISICGPYQLDSEHHRVHRGHCCWNVAAPYVGKTTLSNSQAH
jgi:hypothetical protein